MPLSSYDALALLTRLHEARQTDGELILAVDTETTGLKVAKGDHCIGVSIAGIAGGKPFKEYLPFRHETGENFSDNIRDRAICREDLWLNSSVRACDLNIWSIQ